MNIQAINYPLGWTVVRVGNSNSPDGFYAYNINTGQEMPVRVDYDIAMRDIPESGALEQDKQFYNF